MSRTSGQDPRSFYGRTNLLIDLGLIKRYPVVSDSFNTYLNVYHKFVAQQQEEGALTGDFGISVLELRRLVVKAVKEAKNGLRPIYDIKEELGFNNKVSRQRYFSSQVRKLESQGYIKRVIATMKGSKTIRAKCLKFLQDLPEENEGQSQMSSDESDYSDDDEILTLDADEDAEPPISEGTVDATFLEEDITSSTVAQKSQPSLNLFNTIFPLETQVWFAVLSAGTEGISAKEISARVTGATYSRILSRILDQYMDTGKSGKKHAIPTYLKHLEFVRGTDFKGRAKYFRYFTRESFCAYANKIPDPKWGTFGPLKHSKFSSIKHLNSKFRGNIPGTLNIYVDSHGKEYVVFHGDMGAAIDGEKVPDSTPVITSGVAGKKRGRPRKYNLDSETTSSNNVTPKRGRGRPRKAIKVEPVETNESSAVIEDTPSTAAAGFSTASSGESFEKSSGVNQSSVVQTDRKTKEQRELERKKRYEEKVAKAQEIRKRAEEERLEQLRATAQVMECNSPNKEARSENFMSMVKTENKENQSLKFHLQKIKKESASLSFAGMKRESAIISLLQNHDGVYEGGQPLLNMLRHEVGEGIDRRTMLRTIQSMSDDGKIVINMFRVCPANGIPQDKYYLTLPSLPNDSPFVEQCKDRMRQAVARKYQKSSAPQVKLGELESEFQYYYLTTKNKKLNRAVERLSKRTVSDVQKDRSAITGSFKAGKVDVSGKGKKPPRRRQSARNPLSVNESEANVNDDNDVNKKSRRRGVNRSLEEQDLFYRVVIISRSVYFSVAGIIEWGKIAKAWSEAIEPVTDHSCKIRWIRVRDIYGGGKLVDRSIRRWENVFMKCYENGEISRIEKEDDFDIISMARMWRKNDGELIENNSRWLYRDFDSNAKEYAIQADSSQDAYEHIQTSSSMVKTDEYLTGFCFGYSPTDFKTDHDNISLVKQTIKGIVATDEESYDSTLSKELLNKFSAEDIQEATDELLQQRTIVYIARDREKVVPGRNFTFSEKFLNLFPLKIGNNVYEETTEYENHLVKELSNDKSVKLQGTIPDNHLVSILELLGHGLIHFKRENVTSSKLIDGYRSRNMDKEKLDFDIIIEGMGRKLEFVRPSVDVPVGDGDIHYLWVNVDCSLNTKMWETAAKALLWFISARPGVSLETICQKWNAAFTDDEVLTILKHFSERDVVVERYEQSYWVKPRWYLSMFSNSNI